MLIMFRISLILHYELIKRHFSKKKKGIASAPKFSAVGVLLIFISYPYACFNSETLDLRMLV